MNRMKKMKLLRLAAWTALALAMPEPFQPLAMSLLHSPQTSRW